MGYVLETYEWDRTWIEKSDNRDAKRIFYIGDSISCGTREAANKLSDGGILFDGFGTSRALDNPFYLESLDLFAKFQGKRDVVIFNNGLHGWHLTEKEYEDLYTKYLETILEKYGDVPVVPVLTTFVTNKDFHNDRVIVRNEIVRKIAAEKQLDVIDLYEVSKENQHLLCNDGVHFVEAGYEVLAKAVLKYLKENILK